MQLKLASVDAHGQECDYIYYLVFLHLRCQIYQQYCTVW